MDPARYQRDNPRPRPRRGLPWPAWVGLGCGCLLLTVVVGVGGFAFALVNMMQSSGAYQEALEEIQRSPAVRQALGEPIEGGWWVSGSVNVSGPTGEAGISFPVRGPEGRGTAYVEAVKSAGEWSFQRLEVEVGASGERIDVLEESSDPFELVEAFLEAAGRGDFRQAHQAFSRALVDAQPFEQFSTLAESNAGLFQARQLRLTRGQGVAGPVYEGTLVLAGGREVPASFTLIREQGSWRLVAYQIGS